MCTEMRDTRMHGWVDGWVDGWTDRQMDEWRTSQLLISNLKKCKSATYSIKQEVQKVHNAPERACTCECLNVSLFVAERVRNNFYQKGFLSQKVKDLSFKPGLGLHSPDFTSYIFQCNTSTPGLPVTSSLLSLPIQFTRLRSLAGWRGL